MHLVIRKGRTSKRTTRSQIKQPLLRRKKVVALFAGAMSTGQVRAQIVNLSKKRKL
jgi:hypothetical protein